MEDRSPPEPCGVFSAVMSSQRCFVTGLSLFSLCVLPACSSSSDEEPVQQTMEPAMPAAPASPGAMPAGSDTAPGPGGAAGGNMEAPPVNAPLQNPNMPGSNPGS